MAVVSTLLQIESKLGGSWVNTDYSDQVLGDVQITYGKQDRFEEARAPYAVFTLISGARGIDFNLNTIVKIRIKKISGGQIVFRGFIQSAEFTAETQDYAQATYTAVGILGKLADSEASNIYPSERVSDRVVKVLYSGLNNLIIDALPGTINENTGTIDNWYSYTVASSTDSPIISVQAADSEPSNALSLANYYAAMALGTVTETPGALAPGNLPIPTYYPYAYSSGRSFTLPSEAVYIDQLSMNVTNDRIFNYVTLNINDTFAPYSEVIADPTSIQTYGKLEYTIDTETPSISDSQTYANTFIDDSALDSKLLSGITVRLDLIEDNTLRENLYAIGHYDIITINDIPGALIPGGSFTGKVVGYEFRLAKVAAELSLYLIKEA
jgi:hypothetical protein